MPNPPNCSMLPSPPGLDRDDDAYTAACSSALAGSGAKALDYLERAARVGFRDADHMKADTDLESVRSDPRRSV